MPLSIAEMSLVLQNHLTILQQWSRSRHEDSTRKSRYLRRQHNAIYWFQSQTRGGTHTGIDVPPAQV